jgi:hypothetical protein
MSPSHRQKQAFVESVIDVDYFLESATEWIQNEFSPDELFSEAELEEWAKDNGFIHESEIEEY